MKRTSLSSQYMQKLAALLAAAATVVALIPAVANASSDLPEEAIGYREGAYALSQYETVNLGNGTVILGVPPHTPHSESGGPRDGGRAPCSGRFPTGGTPV